MKKDIKVIIVSLLAIILIWSSVLPSGAIEVIRYYGDIDDDAYVTTADARLALFVAAGIYDGKLYGMDFEAADIDSDDKITTVDARQILRTAAGLAAKKKLVGYQFQEQPEVFVKLLNDYRFEQDHTAIKYSLSPELCDAARLAAEEYAVRTGNALTRDNGKFYYTLLDDMGIEYSAVDKIVVTASANHEKALAAVIADSQAEKTLLRNNFTNIGVSAYSADGRTFYWCIFVTK